MSKESFKKFVSLNSKLVNYVNDNTMTWQKFYEMYELYGENNEVWDKYLKEENTINNSTRNTSVVGDTSLKEVFNMIKNIDVDSVKKGIDGIQKAVGLFQDIGFNKRNNGFNNQYNPRPMYRRFED